MILKNIFIAMLCTMLLAWSGLSMADEYRPDEFLGLDLSKAALSPKLLGPASEFAPVAVEARTDPASEGAQARVQPKAHAKRVVSRNRVVSGNRVVPGNSVVPRTTLAHMRAQKPRGAARTKLARRHGNPLDAEARDTRIQVWPCKSGGICDWQKQKN
ncbi:MAG TPA: hypothetical protein VEN78_38225 [Bradyrhizobium sp.]|nr:hypothetical protein [Bradyrhizobium sp.]